MNNRLRTRGLISALLGGVLVATLAAQSRLYVQEPDDKFHAVFRVNDRWPFIMADGKLVAAKGGRFALKQVEEYLPLFIAIRDKDMRPTNVTVSYADTPSNNGFHFSAKFESAEFLDDVFLALEFEISNVGKKLFVYEIGQLAPRKAKAFSAEIALGQYMSSGQANVHVFVGGSEVFTTEQPEEVRAQMLDRMIAQRISAVKQAGPKPFFGTAPAYPASLSNSGLRGEAVVTMRINSQGVVLEPVLERASAPAFGEEALKVVRDWRFIPRVQDGRPIETKVSIPLEFDPPIATATGKE